MRLSRRGLLRSVVGGVAAGLAGRIASGEASAAERPRIPRRPFGKTGVEVSILALGGQMTLENAGQEEAARAILHRALDLGVNYLETAAAYGDGVSERNLGEVLRTRRREVFLASKSDDRSYDGAMRQLERSLKRLNTDRLDLWQAHNIRTDRDVEFLFSRRGAYAALQKAKEEGAARFIGITGHRDPRVLRRAIERRPFDAILMALNAADVHHPDSFIKELLPAAVERGLGIAAMKIPSRGRIFRKGGLTSMESAMRYVLTLPVSTAVIGISEMRELEEDVRIARAFRPCTREEMAGIERLTAPYFAEANWYKEEW